MSAISETIMSATSHPGDSTVETVEGTAYKGDGYYSRADGFHTVQITVAGFIGTIKLQATLATTPTATDWFDISGVTHTSTATTDAEADGSKVFNFTGKFDWVRAHLVYTDGSINSVKLNH